MGQRSTPSICIEDDVVIPDGVGKLATFRRWALSSEFPDRGRIDFLDGRIEVDMSPEELQSHGVLKSALHLYVAGVVAQQGSGQVFADRARLTSEPAQLSCEPDVLFVSWDALQTERVRYVSASRTDPDRLMEIEGAADLAVEVVSKGSVGKDTKRLPPLYASAGVRELWIADARGNEVKFEIFHLTGAEYRRAQTDKAGFQGSRVLGRKLRILREAGPVPKTWVFTVEEAS